MPYQLKLNTPPRTFVDQFARKRVSGSMTKQVLVPVKSLENVTPFQGKSVFFNF